MKHTKGEWIARKLHEDNLVSDQFGVKYSYNRYWIHAGEEGRVIADISFKEDCENQGYGNINNEKEWEANVKLISKAPEMYEALKKLYNSAITTVDDQVIIRTDVNSIIEMESLLKEIES